MTRWGRLNISIILLSLFLIFISNEGLATVMDGIGAINVGERIVSTFDDVWTHVPKLSGQPEIDGLLTEGQWMEAARLGSFKNAFKYDLKEDGPDYVIAHDGEHLYLGGTLSRSEHMTLAFIEVIVVSPTDPDTHFVVSVPVKPSPVLRRTNWGVNSSSGRIDVSGFKSRLTTDEEQTTVEIAIPFNKLGLRTSDDLGKEWKLNVVHVHDHNTVVLSSWIPIQTYDYSRGGLTFGARVNLRSGLIAEDRFGSLYFLDDDQREHDPASDSELRFESFTKKTLSIVTNEGISDRFTIVWTPPDGDSQTLLPDEQFIDDERVTLTFTHAPPLENGIYRLKVLGDQCGCLDDVIVRLAFDRNQLIDAGEGDNDLVDIDSKISVPWKPASNEVESIIRLVPDKSGFQVAGVPTRPGEKPIQALYRLSDDGMALIEVGSNKIYPNDDYPENKSVTVTGHNGRILTYPYYEDTSGRRYFFTGRLWFEQRIRAMDEMKKLVSGDPLGAARILLRFAEVADGYVPIMNSEWNVYPINASAGPVDFSGIWSPWHVVDLTRGLIPLLDVFKSIRRTDAFDLLSTEIGMDVERYIVEELFDRTIDSTLRFPIAMHNTAPYLWQGLIEAGITLGRPDYIHFVVEWMDEFLKSQFVSDGFWKEITLSYHNQVVSNVEEALYALQGYSDPPGYISPRTGKRFDSLDLAKDFPILSRAQRMKHVLTYPDGSLLPIQDTWANQKSDTPDPSQPLLLSSAGVARLAVGSGTSASQLYMMFTPKYGHNHMDPLNITLFSGGQELLPDLGYSSAKYRMYTTSTIGHNTVLVNSRNMEITDETRPGGRIDRFLPQTGLFQLMRASQTNAYEDVDEYSRELWAVPFPTNQSNSGGMYVLDIFRVVGGHRHEYVLQGDANKDAAFYTDFISRDYGQYLLPSGVQVREPTSQSDFGSAGVFYPGYMYVRDVKKIQPGGDRYEITLKTHDSFLGRPISRMQMSITSLLDAGVHELYLGRSPSLRSTRLHGKSMDNNNEANKYDLPKLVLRRDGNNGLESTFVTLMEPYRGTDNPKINQLIRLPLEGAPQGAVAIKVKYGNTTDILISNPSPNQLVQFEDVTLRGEFGMIRTQDEKVTNVVLAGGSLLEIGERRLTDTGSIFGTVINTLSKASGDPIDGLVTDVVISDNAIDSYVIVTHPDGQASGYKVSDVIPQNGKGGASIIVLDNEDPGFEILPDGSSRQTYYPGHRWTGKHELFIPNIAVYNDQP